MFYPLEKKKNSEKLYVGGGGVSTSPPSPYTSEG